MFIGRVGEIEKLNSFYESDSCSVAAVTGSIGMGKTTLLRHFSQDKKTIFFTAYETTGKHQLELLAEQFGLGKGVTIADICEKISEVAALEKLLVVIDQYPNLVKADAEFDKVLLSYVTGQWKNLPVKLILCGDAFVQMDKYVLNKKAGWLMQLDLYLKVEAMGFYDALEFLPEVDMNTALYLYGITGGIPYNLSRVSGDIKADTIKLFLDKDYAVGLNPEQVMATELRELSYYNYMLTTLAKGLNRVNQISAEVDKPKDVVVPYLNSLMSIGVVTKDTAITELKNRKKTRYSIVNTSTLFWYRYIVPNIALYASKDIDALWSIIEADLADYMQQVFIRVCAEYLQKGSKAGDLPFSIEETGNWWVNDDEAGTTDGFDLVSLGKCDGKSATVFCQCYYTDGEIEVAQLKMLIEKTKQLHRQGDVFYLVFSKDGFNENAVTISSAIKNIMLIKLDEMKY